jgi:rfaE bifunctional protein kinase chain/domain
MAGMTLREIVDRFEGRTMVVLGDLGVDCYVETHPMRLSREAPVMVLRYRDRRYLPGCAANTVMNLRQLGARVVPIGFVGDDEAGKTLLAAFRAAGIPDDGIVVTGESLLKVRLTSGVAGRPQQQLVRVDVDPDAPRAETALHELIARAGAAEGAEGIVVSDYGYGAASPGLLRAVQEAAGAARVSVDSRHHLAAYEGADLLTPNEGEATALLGRPIETDAEALEAASELRRRVGAGAVLLTRGNRGMAVADGTAHMLPIAGTRDIVDPSGAGDTVVAAAARARAGGGGEQEAGPRAIRPAGGAGL